MPLTPAQQYAANANAVIAIVQQLEQLRASVNEIVTANSNTPFGNGWALLGTVALNSDGSPGTADGSPTAGHPLNAATYGINGYLTTTQLAALLAFVVELQSLLAGSAVSANGATAGTLQSVAVSP